MNRHFLAFAAMSLLGVSTVMAQGSGSTEAPKTAAKPAQKSSYETVKHVNGVVTSRSASVITVKAGSKTRRFSVTSGTSFKGTKAATGAKVKISYKSNAPGVAVEVRSRS